MTSNQLQIILYGIGANIVLTMVLYISFRNRMMAMQDFFYYKIRKTNEEMSDLVKNLSAGNQTDIKALTDILKQQFFTVLKNQNMIHEKLCLDNEARAIADTDIQRSMQEVKDELLSLLIQTNTLIAETSKAELEQFIILREKNLASQQKLLDKTSLIITVLEDLQKQLNTAANDTAERYSQVGKEVAQYFDRLIKQTENIATQISNISEKNSAQLESFIGYGQKLANVAEILAQRAIFFSDRSFAELEKNSQLLNEWDKRAVRLEELTEAAHKDSFLMLELLKAGLLSDLLKDMQAEKNTPN
ncbi:hypothetical protein [Emticicia fontis]